MKVLDLESRNQKFRCVLEGVQHQVRLIWNARAGTWTVDIETLDGVPVACGVALQTGVNPFSHMQLDLGSFVIFDTAYLDQEAGINSIGSTHLIAQLEESET